MRYFKGVLFIKFVNIKNVINRILYVVDDNYNYISVRYYIVRETLDIVREKDLLFKEIRFRNIT